METVGNIPGSGLTGGRVRGGELPFRYVRAHGVPGVLAA